MRRIPLNPQSCLLHKQTQIVLPCCDLRGHLIFAIPENVFSFTLHQFRIQSRVKLLDNGSSGLLPVESKPAVSKMPITIQLHCVSDRNSGRNHELDKQGRSSDLLRREGFRNLGEEN